MTGIPVAPGELCDTTCINEWVRTHYRLGTQAAISNTSALTDLLNGGVTIGAGAMSTNKTLRLLAKVSVVNTLATESLPRFQLTLGGATLIDTSGPSGGLLTGASSFLVEALITNVATASQVYSLKVHGAGAFAAVSNPFLTGNGNYAVGGTGNLLATAFGIGSGSTVNTALAQALALNIKFNVASTSLSATLLDAFVEVV